MVYFFFHRAAAARLAISFRFLADRLAARAFPPFSPPRRPSSTAKGSLTGGVSLGASPVSWSMMFFAIWFTSRDFAGVFAMLPLCLSGQGKASEMAAQRKCPECGGDWLVQVVYLKNRDGQFPYGDYFKARKGKAAIGRSKGNKAAHRGSNRWHCKKCGHTW